MRTAGHETTVLYQPNHRERLSRGDLPDHRCAVDSYSRVESLWSALHHLGSSAPVDAVVTTHESAVLPTAVLGRLIGARGIPPEVALACRDKAVQKDRWRAAGVPTAALQVFPDGLGEKGEAARRLAHAGMGFPLVVKPPAGGASRAVAVARDMDELVAAAHAVDGGGRVLVESFVEGPEWHLDGVLVDGTLDVLAVSKYGEPVRCTKQGRPVTSIALSPNRDAKTYARAEEFTERAVRALGLDRGAFHLEVFGEPGNLVAGELACRPGGGMVDLTVRRTVGVDLWAAAAQAITGDPIRREPVRRDLTYGWVILPTCPGKVNLVTEADLTGLPGIEGIDMRIEPGAVMGDIAHTASTGVAFATVRGAGEAACRQAIEHVVATVRRIHADAPDERPRAA